ncbi:hypothetical protein TNCV_3414181 [Trichonephila clavipes]|uniref:Uncharacterized protein n=1 Tax=Trichonephila clavipes TaxID=2585209 RepID=A0A8X6RM40_TRICX|nr:hypothetical protein TNCV_3414181 [Trichonephila clavipes]
MGSGISRQMWECAIVNDHDRDNGKKLLNCCIVIGPSQVSAVPGVCQMTGSLPPLLDSVVDGGTPEQSCFRAWGSNAAAVLG